MACGAIGEAGKAASPTPILGLYERAEYLLTTYSVTWRDGCSPGSTLKKKKGQTSDQCGSHHLHDGTLQGKGTIPPSNVLFLLWGRARKLFLSSIGERGRISLWGGRNLFLTCTG